MKSSSYKRVKTILKISSIGILASLVLACTPGEAADPKPEATEIQAVTKTQPDTEAPVKGSDKESMQKLLAETKETEAKETEAKGTEPEEIPAEAFTAKRICEGDEVFNRINGKSYVKNPHVDLEELRYLTLLYFDFNHEIQVGELITHEDISEDTLKIFKELYEAEYEIEAMHLVDNYWEENGDGVSADAESMRQNNTSCFNYRVVPDSKSISKHAMGYAIDINPRENPYVVFDKGGKQVLKGGDASYMDRSNKRPHMIDHEDLAFRVFSQYGFQWGGDWSSSRDYQHFVKVK